MDATLADINHHIIPILNKNPDVIVLRVGKNDFATRTSREIFDDLLLLKGVISKTLSNYKVIFLQPTLQMDNGKAASII